MLTTDDRQHTVESGPGWHQQLRICIQLGTRNWGSHKETFQGIVEHDNGGFCCGPLNHYLSGSGYFLALRDPSCRGAFLSLGEGPSQGGVDVLLEPRKTYLLGHLTADVRRRVL